MRNREKGGRPGRCDDSCEGLGISALDLRCNSRREVITRKRVRCKRVGDGSELAASVRSNQVQCKVFSA